MEATSKFSVLSFDANAKPPKEDKGAAKGGKGAAKPNASSAANGPAAEGEEDKGRKRVNVLLKNELQVIRTSLEQAPQRHRSCTSTSTRAREHEHEYHPHQQAALHPPTQVQAKWAEEGTFESNPLYNDDGSPKPKFMVTFPYPYMNGRLHLGHAFSLTKAEFAAG